MRYRTVLIIWLFAGSIWLLAGCGGGESAESGRAIFTVVWPESTRLIPEAAQSIFVELSRNNAPVTARIIPRPVGGGPASATFFDLPVGPMTAVATAHPQANGSGVAQASGSVVFTVQAGQTAAFTLTMASTIERMEITPTNPTPIVGATIQFTAAARDAFSNVVLTSPARLRWETSDSARGTIDANGRFTAKTEGSITVTVTETESGKFASISFTISVMPANVRCDSLTGHCYEKVPALGISVAAAKAAAEARTLFGKRGHLVTFSSQAETNFLVTNLGVAGYVVGCYQDQSSPSYSEPAGGWRWTTNEPFVYSNWYPGEPTNTGGFEHAASFHADGRWNDIYGEEVGGYFIEYE